MNTLINQKDITTLSEEEQINELNGQTKCTLRPSSIDGVGVFTMVDVKRGERLYCQLNLDKKWYNISYKSFDKLLPFVREIIMQRFPSVVNGSLFQSPNDNAHLILFMNHSSIPNYNSDTDTATQDIKLGEEVLEDYRTMDNWQRVFSFIRE